MRRALSPQEIQNLATELCAWRVVENHHLHRHFKFKDFVSALDFVNRIGAEAERQGHHPNISLTWGKVEVEIWTHDLNALSDKDVALAKAIDRQS